MDPSTWTPDNWIAFAAICASVIVSVAGFFFSFFTNRANIKARRIEIVTEKSIEAYRELVGILEWFVSGYSSSEWLTEDGSKKAREMVNECLELHTKYSVYFPRTISRDIFKVLGMWHDAITFKSKQDNLNEFVKLMHHATNETINLKRRIQKHIGVETKEQPSWRDALTRKVEQQEIDYYPSCLIDTLARPCKPLYNRTLA